MIITLDMQMACVARELAYRRRCYPKWVAAGKMTQDKADHELAVMEAVQASLLEVQESRLGLKPAVQP